MIGATIKKAAAGLLTLFLALPAAPQEPPGDGDIPHASERLRQDYAAYRLARSHRAFAIAPGGAWGWVEGEESGRVAADSALARCADQSEQKCILYALDERVVFDRERWTRLWGPYKSAALAESSLEGIRVGQRFPELVFSGAGGAGRLSDERGRVTILYFLASWCGVCRQELPKLAALQREVSERPDLALILVPYREPSDALRSLLETGRLEGGSLAGLAPLLRDTRTESSDRWEIGELAPGVPTSFVLDKNGVVLFSRRGPVEHWDEYLPLIDDARDRSGTGAG